MRSSWMSCLAGHDAGGAGRASARIRGSPRARAARCFRTTDACNINIQRYLPGCRSLAIRARIAAPERRERAGGAGRLTSTRNFASRPALLALTIARVLAADAGGAWRAWELVGRAACCATSTTPASAASSCTTAAHAWRSGASRWRPTRRRCSGSPFERLQAGRAPAAGELRAARAATRRCPTTPTSARSARRPPRRRRRPGCCCG